MKRQQKHRVIEFMKRHGGITSYEAFQELGITRLAAVIYDLRHEEGRNIVTEKRTVKTRSGRTATIAHYKFGEEEEDEV